MAAGVPSGKRSQSGSRLMTAERVSVTVSPSNAGLPVSISYSTQPNAHMSVRRSTGLPRACSGLMYAAVPRMTPTAVPPLVMVGAAE